MAAIQRKTERTVLLVALLGLNAWAGACSIISPPPDPDFEKWHEILVKSRTTEINSNGYTSTTIPSYVSPTFEKPPSLTIEEAEDLDKCPAKVLARYKSSELPLIACQTINRPFAEMRTAAIKAYAHALVSQKGNTFRFIGGGRNEFWNGTQLTILPQSKKTLLIWQSIGREPVADQILKYLETQLWKFQDKHDDYWLKPQPQRSCNALGIVNQSFAKFSKCIVTTVDGEYPIGGDVYFKLASAKDESLQPNIYYSIAWGSTCPSFLAGPFKSIPK